MSVSKAGAYPSGPLIRYKEKKFTNIDSISLRLENNVVTQEFEKMSHDIYYKTFYCSILS